ncbi:hypothetical protein MKW98_016231 [Papaver atlanticum]|uniref:Uncharacterized protein n=1 Tax=Papaver atlanticum TaxID=357466 RepID=A0AAD4SIG6_9MAGN|nr:hypothetical protein MKW98_016231 [Papaver atlanticum]
MLYIVIFSITVADVEAYFVAVAHSRECYYVGKVFLDIEESVNLLMYSKEVVAFRQVPWILPVPATTIIGRGKSE